MAKLENRRRVPTGSIKTTKPPPPPAKPIIEFKRKPRPAQKAPANPLPPAAATA